MGSALRSRCSGVPRVRDYFWLFADAPIPPCCFPGQVPAHMGAPSLSLCFHLPVPIPAAPPEEGRHGWGCVGHGAPLLAVLPDLVLLRVAAAG